MDNRIVSNFCIITTPGPSEALCLLLPTSQLLLSLSSPQEHGLLLDWLKLDLERKLKTMGQRRPEKQNKTKQNKTKQIGNGIMVIRNGLSAS